MIISVLVFTLSSCQKSLEKTLPGEWWASDVQIEADPANFDSVRLKKIKENEESVYFIFHEDKSVEIKTGGTNIKGTWSIGDDKNSIYLVTEVSRSKLPVLFGKYEDGLIRTETKGPEGIVIRTAYKER